MCGLHPGGRDWVHQDLNFLIKLEIIALIGENGAGKTTPSLRCSRGLYDPTVKANPGLISHWTRRVGRRKSASFSDQRGIR